MDAARLHSQEAGLEQSLGAPEPLVTDGDDLAVGQLVGFLQRTGGSGSGHLLLEVQGDVAELLFYVPDDLPLGGGGERVTPLGENLHQVICEVTTSQVQPEDGMRQGVTLVDGNSVRDAVTRVEDDPSCS